MKFSQVNVKKPNIKQIIVKMNTITEQFKNAPTFAEAFKIYMKMEKLMEALSSDVSVINVKFTLNVQDEYYANAMNELDEELPLLTEPNLEFIKALLHGPYVEDFRKKYGDYFIKMMENSLRSQDPKLINEQIELNKLSSQYQMITGTAQIEFRGETYNLSQIGKFSTSDDRKTRKEAALASAKWVSEHNDEIGEIYDKMVKIRHQMALKLGFKNFTELGYLNLGRTDYDSEMVKKYREQIKEVAVPLAQKLWKKQRQRIGVKTLYFYDLNYKFTDGNPIPNGTPEELIQKAHQMYHDMSDVTGEFFDILHESELLDVIARPGKTPGGYMTSFARYKLPFIFANFNGTQGDVEVLTHEFGHAFQYYLSRNIKPSEYVSPTLEACEIHSMSMEFITWPWMNMFFDDVQKFKISHLEGALTFLPYGALVDEFQHYVYENPEVGHQERMAKWSELEKIYEPHRNYESCDILNKGALWLRQAHIFNSPFYYIDYTLAQVVAFQFLIESQKDWEKAWKKYLKLCKLGGKYPFTQLLEKAHLRVPFVDGNIKKTFSPLKRILKELE